MRKLGILLHITSLYGRDLIGTLGKPLFEMLKVLKEANISVWQMLPICPSGYAGSPYSSPSLFAFNPFLIDIDSLNEEGLIDKDDFKRYFSLVEKEKQSANFAQNKVNYSFLEKEKLKVLRLAGLHTIERLKKDEDLRREYTLFCKDMEFWLETYAYFMVLQKSGKYSIKEIMGRFRKKREKVEKSESETKEMEVEKVLQFFFYRQWLAFRKAANEEGILLFGDLAIFPSYNSADIASHSDLFYIDENDDMTFVAGVPPDYFSSEGQLWGNPLYNWQKMKEDDYSWWKERIKHSLKLFDFLRLDHFRSFHSFWAIPNGSPSAKNGRWIAGPGKDFFYSLQKELKSDFLPLIAEDLGIITENVKLLKDSFGLMGMKILQFAFYSSQYKNEDVSSPYLPHNVEECSLMYTGTHDNDTTFGWVSHLSKDEKEFLLKYLDLADDASIEKIAKALVRLAISSHSRFAIIPLQDFCTLDSSNRMNVPSEKDGNWQWRMERGLLCEPLLREIKDMAILYERNK